MLSELRAAWNKGVLITVFEGEYNPVFEVMMLIVLKN